MRFSFGGWTDGDRGFLAAFSSQCRHGLRVYSLHPLIPVILCVDLSNIQFCDYYTDVGAFRTRDETCSAWASLLRLPSGHPEALSENIQQTADYTRLKGQFEQIYHFTQQRHLASQVIIYIVKKKPTTNVVGKSLLSLIEKQRPHTPTHTVMNKYHPTPPLRLTVDLYITLSVRPAAIFNNKVLTS